MRAAPVFASIALALTVPLFVPQPVRAQVAHETVQADLDAILADLEDISLKLGDAEAARLAAVGRELASTLVAKELEVILDAVVTLGPLRTRVDALRRAVDEAGMSAGASLPLAEGEFPEPAPFPDVPVLHIFCEILGNTAVTALLLEAHAIAEIVHASAEHGCEQTIELIGEGGNLSIACAPPSAIEAVLKGMVENAEFCRAGQHESLDDATYEGTRLVYEEVKKIEGIDEDIEMRLARIEEAIDELRGLVVSLAREQALTQVSGRRFSRFQQPGEDGIDATRAVALERIESVESRSGQPATRARAWLRKGDRALERGDYAQAFRFYQKAYLVRSGS